MVRIGLLAAAFGVFLSGLAYADGGGFGNCVKLIPCDASPAVDCITAAFGTKNDPNGTLIPHTTVACAYIMVGGINTTRTCGSMVSSGNQC